MIISTNQSFGGAHTDPVSFYQQPTQVSWKTWSHNIIINIWGSLRFIDSTCDEFFLADRIPLMMCLWGSIYIYFLFSITQMCQDQLSIQVSVYQQPTQVSRKTWSHNIMKNVWGSLSFIDSTCDEFFLAERKHLKMWSAFARLLLSLFQCGQIHFSSVYIPSTADAYHEVREIGCVETRNIVCQKAQSPPKKYSVFRRP